jgi:hypothetical protein
MLNFHVFRYAIDPTQMTLIPVNSSINISDIGNKFMLSPGDVLSLNKAYSCAARAYTNGGGVQTVCVYLIVQSLLC